MAVSKTSITKVVIRSDDSSHALALLTGNGLSAQPTSPQLSELEDGSPLSDR